MRGEKYYNAADIYAAGGSPPHTRGKAYLIEPFAAVAGITPAYAGKRSHELAQARRPWGSPPHTRGKAGSLAMTGRPQRITPACAGKRTSLNEPPVWLGDHPRMRGEKKVIMLDTETTGGSPPHARGKAPREAFLPMIDQITPACAGKSCRLAISLILCWDHPRMRGEKADSKTSETL